ncbi:hypothetical protein GS506_11330 [Rhodococcus hoagii]|nr:hypothetical protein [Prescottella equi]
MWHRSRSRGITSPHAVAGTPRAGRNPTSPPPRRHRPGKPTLTASASLLPAMVDLAVTGIPTEGIAVGGLSALAVGVAAVAI